jgi:Porphobilinogen deaminase
MNNKITIGSRGSKLSLAYANKVKNLISRLSEASGSELEIKTIKTSGDLFQNKKISANWRKKFILQRNRRKVDQ